MVLPSPCPLQIRKRSYACTKFKFRSHANLTMTSCEPHRSGVYSDDLHWRVVWQRHASHNANLNVDVTTVRRILNTFSATGTVSKKYPAERAFRKITEPVQLFILHLVLKKPGIYLHEITAEVELTLGLDLTEGAVCKFLSKIGANDCLQWDDHLRQVFVADMYPCTHMILSFLYMKLEPMDNQKIWLQPQRKARSWLYVESMFQL